MLNENELKGPFGGSLSHNVVSGLFPFVLSFFLLQKTNLYKNFNFCLFNICFLEYMLWLSLLCFYGIPVSLNPCFLCYFFGSFPSVCLFRPLPARLFSLHLTLFYSLDVCFLLFSANLFINSFYIPMTAPHFLVHRVPPPTPSPSPKCLFSKERQ